MTDVKIAAPKSLANRWLEIFSRNLLFVVGVLLLVFCFMEYLEHSWQWLDWDVMLITGLLAFIVALSLAQTIPARMAQTLERLEKRGVLQSSDQSLPAFQTKLETRAQLFAKIGALVVGLAIVAAFLAAYRSYIVYEIPLTLFELFLGAVAGYYIGQMIAYGTLGQLITPREKVSIVVKPGHIDRAAGLKPIGDFYFFQAMIVAIPCLYIAVWWFVIPFFPYYMHWRDPYLGLLAVVIVFEILSFIVPMWAFHLLMQAQKTRCLNEVDELSNKLVDLENRIRSTPNLNEIGDLQKQLDIQREKCLEIEAMPTWPVDALTRRKFTINNLLLFLPFFSEFIRISTFWEKLLRALAKIFES